MGTSYCDIAPGHEWHGPYHDREYGFPLRGDAELFERLILEINQAGLSWLTILKKRDAFRRAYDGFDPAVVARYGARDRRRLLADPGIIRNRLKVEAAIANAGRVLPRETLIDRVWGTDYVGDTKTLDVHVKRLRSKIEPDPANPTRIVTIRGLGYKYERV